MSRSVLIGLSAVSSLFLSGHHSVNGTPAAFPPSSAHSMLCRRAPVHDGTDGADNTRRIERTWPVQGGSEIRNKLWSSGDWRSNKQFLKWVVSLEHQFVKYDLEVMSPQIWYINVKNGSRGCILLIRITDRTWSVHNGPDGSDGPIRYIMGVNTRKTARFILINDSEKHGPFSQCTFVSHCAFYAFNYVNK